MDLPKSGCLLARIRSNIKSTLFHVYFIYSLDRYVGNSTCIARISHLVPRCPNELKQVNQTWRHAFILFVHTRDGLAPRGDGRDQPCRTRRRRRRRRILVKFKVKGTRRGDTDASITISLHPSDLGHGVRVVPVDQEAAGGFAASHARASLSSKQKPGGACGAQSNTSPPNHPYQILLMAQILPLPSKVKVYA